MFDLMQKLSSIEFISFFQYLHIDSIQFFIRFVDKSLWLRKSSENWNCSVCQSFQVHSDLRSDHLVNLVSITFVYNLVK